jgi:hypothetical protein
MNKTAEQITGWTEYFAETFGADELHLSIAPDADLDDIVVAFCHDEQQMIRIQGWNFTFSKVVQ